MKQYLIRFAKSRAVGVALIVLLLAGWEIGSRLGVRASPNWPPVTRILAAGFDIIADGSLLSHMFATLRRMFVGYSIAVLLGVTVGTAIGYFRFLYNLFEPTIELLRPIPSPAYLPLLILFFGIGDLMKILLIVVATFFPVVLNTYGGIRSVDPVEIQTARTFGLRSKAILKEVAVPAASPQIFTGMRISLAIALIVSILAEMLAGSNGLGFLIVNAQRTFRAPVVYVIIFILGLVGYILNRSFLLMERRVLRWHVAMR